MLYLFRIALYSPCFKKLSHLKFSFFSIKICLYSKLVILVLIWNGTFFWKQGSIFYKFQCFYFPISHTTGVYYPPYIIFNCSIIFRYFRHIIFLYKFDLLRYNLILIAFINMAFLLQIHIYISCNIGFPSQIFIEWC